MNEELMEMLDDETITFPEFDNCIAGVVIRANGSPVVCYDYYKAIEKLKLDMSEEDAIEHFYFNIVGSYLGEGTPCFLLTSPLDDDSTDL